MPFLFMQPAMMLISYGAVFLSIWLVAGMAESDPSVVGSIASFVNYLSQIIFTIVMVGFFGELSYSGHDFPSSYS